MGIFKKYNLIFFDSFSEAKLAKEKLASLCAQCQQLNLVIREEGSMDDVDLLSIDSKIKVFAGKAWTSIHERRVAEGWYENQG